MSKIDINSILNVENIVSKKLVTLRPQQIIRIDLSSQDILFVGFGVTLAENSVILKIGGYGAGAERIIVNKDFGNTLFELYINGSSELGCVYLKSTFDKDDYQLMKVSVVSMMRESVEVNFVDNIPTDAKKINL